MTAYPEADFSSSHALFQALVAHLSGSSAAGLQHGEVEELIEDEGRELLRALFQDHLDLRAAREEARVKPVRGADGVERTEVRRGRRQLGTVFGTVGVQRLALVKRGVHGGLRPMDAELNLPSGRYSHGVARRVAWGVAESSYEVAVEDLRRETGASIAKRQAEQLAVQVTSDFEDFYLARPFSRHSAEDVLVLSFDGSGVVMRPEGLRAETRAAAGAERRRSTAQTAGAVGARQHGVRKNRKRMAEVAAVYDLAVQPRSPDDIVRELRRSGPHKPRPRAKNKRVWASLERTVPTVVEDAFLEAWRRDPDQQRRWAVLVDGNKHQIDSVLQIGDLYGVPVTIVVDFIHVLGYLWKAGKALVGGDLDAIEAWVEDRSRRILRGGCVGVARGMRCAATRRKLSKAARRPVDACARYLLNHKQYLRYHEFLADGLPIASGVIEGTCRSLVKDRMDITGARWGLQGAEAVLKLRALRASGDLDDYLEYHRRRELDRNHLAKFDEDELVELRLAS